MAEKIFWKILGGTRKSIQFGKLDQKSLFFYQKPIRFKWGQNKLDSNEARTNWIQMRPEQGPTQGLAQGRAERSCARMLRRCQKAQGLILALHRKSQLPPKIPTTTHGPFSPIYHFFDLSKLKFALKTFIFIQQEILEARFRPPNSTFSPQLPPPHFFQFCRFLDLRNSV